MSGWGSPRRAATLRGVELPTGRAHSLRKERPARQRGGVMRRAFVSVTAAFALFAVMLVPGVALGGPSVEAQLPPAAAAGCASDAKATTTVAREGASIASSGVSDAALDASSAVVGSRCSDR